MKTWRILVLVGWSLVSFQSEAQTAAQQRRTFIGVKGGYNLATADFFNSLNGWNFNNGFVTGFQGGIVAMNSFRDHVGVQLELLYSQKGWKQKFGEGREDFDAHLDYIELPLLVNVHTGKKNSHFFVSAGCFVEYLVSVSQSQLPSESTIGDWDFIYYDDSRDYNFGYGGKAGAGYFHNFPFGTIMVTGDFSYSLSNIIDYGRLSPELPSTSNKMVVGISVSYLFSLKVKQEEDQRLE